MYRLVREQFFAQPREEIFGFFLDARNLQRITPDFLHFRILTPLPLEMKQGTLLDYRLRLHGIGFGWRARIEDFEPPARFSDRQLKGPYRVWYHVHEFEERDGGTFMTDRIDYALPFGPLGTLAHALYVERTLRRIFDYRRDVLVRQFG